MLLSLATCYHFCKGAVRWSGKQEGTLRRGLWQGKRYIRQKGELKQRWQHYHCCLSLDLQVALQIAVYLLGLPRSPDSSLDLKSYFSPHIHPEKNKKAESERLTVELSTCLRGLNSLSKKYWSTCTSCSYPFHICNFHKRNSR